MVGQQSSLVWTREGPRRGESSGKLGSASFRGRGGDGAHDVWRLKKKIDCKENWMGWNLAGVLHPASRLGGLSSPFSLICFVLFLCFVWVWFLGKKVWFARQPSVLRFFWLVSNPLLFPISTISICHTSCIQPFFSLGRCLNKWSF